MASLTVVHSFAGSTTATAKSATSFTPAVGDIVLVQNVAEDAIMTLTAPTATGLTFTQYANLGTSGATTRVAGWYAKVATSQAYVISYGANAGRGAGWTSGVVKWYTGADLAATPATHTLLSAGSQPSDSITTVGTNSVVDWIGGDWAAVAGTPAYRSSAVEDFKDQTGSGVHYCAYYAHQTAAVAGAQTYGMTAPSGQTSTLAGIEILDTGAGPAPSPAVWAHWRLTPPGTRSPGSGRFIPTPRGDAQAIQPFFDDFNRADGPLGPNWQTSSVPCTIVSQQVQSNAAASAHRWGPDTATDDQYVQATYVGTATFVGVSVQVASLAATPAFSAVAPFYSFRQNGAGGGCALIEKVAASGSNTTLASSTTNFVGGDVIRLEYISGVLYGKINGLVVLTAIPSSQITGRRGVGFTFGTTTTVPLLDDWSGGDLAAPPVGGGQTFPLPVATEADTAQALAAAKTRVLPVSTETYGLTYNAAVTAITSLIGRWKLDDTSGTVVTAAVGSNGTYTGPPTQGVTGLVQDGGTAVTTDGSATTFSVPATTGQTSIAFWSAHGAGGAAGTPIMRDATSAAGSGWFIDISGTNPIVRAAGTSHTVTTVTASTLRTGSRHLYVLQSDGTNVALFIDGTQVDTWVQAGAFSTLAWIFGKNGNVAGQFYGGTFDDVATFNALLSPTDVTNLWNSGTGAAAGAGAQTLGRVRSRALPIATETDTAQALGRLKSRVLGIAAETGVAQALGRLKSRILPISSETDTAQTITRTTGQTLALPVATETDTAQALGRRKTRALPVATETDTAQTLARAKRLTLPVATETDTAQSFSRRKVRALVVATTADVAQALGRVKRLTLPIASTTSAAQTLGRVRSRILPIATSTNTAQPFARLKSRVLGIATETDKANRFGRPLPIARETDTAVPIFRRGTFVPATETDTAQPFARTKSRVLPVATEADTAVVLARAKRRTLGIAAETDNAQVLGRIRSRVLGVATSSNIAQTFGRLRSRLLGRATETDTAVPLGHVFLGGIPVDNPTLTLTVPDSVLTLTGAATGVLTITDTTSVLVLTPEPPPTLTVSTPDADLTMTGAP